MTDTALPGIVLLPGMDGTDALLGPLQRALAAHTTVRTVVLPHDGPQGYGDLLPHVLTAVDVASPSVVLGWSFSGPLALRAAQLRPDVVRGVVLVASFVTPPIGWLPWLGPLLCTPAFALVRTARRLPLWLLRPDTDPFRVAKARIWREVPARTLVARARTIARVDARGVLQSCPQPLLYLRSAADRVVHARNLDLIRSLRPDVREHTLPGGHFALFPAASDAAAVIREFLAAAPS